jgi:hypothetical protein
MVSKGKNIWLPSNIGGYFDLIHSPPITSLVSGISKALAILLLGEKCTSHTANAPKTTNDKTSATDIMYSLLFLMQPPSGNIPQKD